MRTLTRLSFTIVVSFFVGFLIASCFHQPTHAQANRTAALPVRASALTTTVKVISTGPTILDSIICMNPNAAAGYLQLFNTSATVTLGTTVPTLAISFPNSGPLVIPNVNLGFYSGLAAAVATTATGNTAVGVAFDCNFGVR